MVVRPYDKVSPLGLAYNFLEMFFEHKKMEITDIFKKKINRPSDLKLTDQQALRAHTLSVYTNGKLTPSPLLKAFMGVSN